MSVPARDELRIVTPEGVTFSFALAGPMVRGVAAVLDIGCVAVLSAALAAVARLLGVVLQDVGSALLVVGYFALSIGYGIAAEWYGRGQTIGKRLLRLRVIDERGLRLHFSQVVIRNLLRSVDMLPWFYLVGGAACFLNRRAQRLGDLAAGTVVVRTPPVERPDVAAVTGLPFNSLRRRGRVAARLRQRISPAEAGVLLQAVLRREQFDPAERVRLFGELAARVRELERLPEEEIEVVSDEQLVRNVVDILFSPAESRRG